MSYAERLSYGYIEQTCPKVDALEYKCLELIQEDLEGKLGDLLNKDQIQMIGNLVQYRVETLVGMIKEFVTEPLREALIDCCNSISDFENENDEALKYLDKVESEKGMLESDIDWYKSEVLRLESEISNLETKLGDLLWIGRKT